MIYDWPRPARSAAVLVIAIVLVTGCARGREDRGEPATPGPAEGAGSGGPDRPAPAQAGLVLLSRGDLKGAEPLLVEARRQSPDDPRVLEGLGGIYARTDRLRQAEEAYRAALARQPDSSRAALGLASVFIDSGRTEEALVALREILARQPEEPLATLKLALLEARQGDAAAAEAGARRAIARQPDNPEAHYVLGLALGRSGRVAEAAQAMRRTQELDPGHLGALSHLVTYAARLGDPQGAERWRRAWQEALGRQRVEERVRGHRLKGVDAFNRGDFRTALDEFQVIAREDPEDPQVHLHLGSTYIALRDYQRARAALQRSLELDPRSERALVEIGRLHALTGSLDEAIAALQKAIEINPEFPEPHYYLAGILMARGDAAGARRENERFEELRRRSSGSAMEIQTGDRR